MIKPLFQKIVVAVNGSESSVCAAMYGIMMAKTLNCKMKAVYVIDTATLKQLEMLRFLHAAERNRYEERLGSDGQRNLDYISNLAKGKGIKIETELKKGAVWSELVRVSDEFESDLILLGGQISGNVLKRDKISAANSEIIGSSPKNVLVVKDSGIESRFKLL